MLLTLALAVWVGLTVRHVHALRDDLQALGERATTAPTTLGVGLDALRRDLRWLRRDLALPLALAPHLGWLPGVGPTVRAAPTLVDGAERLLESAITVWKCVGVPTSSALFDAADSQVATVLSESVNTHAAELAMAATEARAAWDSLLVLDADALDPRVGRLVAMAQRIAPLAQAGLDMLVLTPGRVGDQGSATWLLLAQNSDELRATGGFISSIGALVLTPDLPRVEPFVDSYAVENWDAAHPDPPEALREQMGIDLLTTRDANWWPHFPTSAEAVTELYALNQGARPQGVVAITSSAATRLLEALTPISLPDGERLLAGDVEAAYRRGWSIPEQLLVAPPVVVTATRDLVGAEVLVVLNNRQGRAWIDDVRLELADAPGVNLVVDGSFETPLAGVDGSMVWQLQGLTSDDGLDAERAADGDHSLRLVGVLGSSKRLWQEIEVSAPAGTQLLLSAQAATEGVDPLGGYFGVQLRMHYADGTRELVSAGLPPFTHDWATAGTVKEVEYWFAHRKDFVQVIWQAARAKLTTSPDEVRWADLLVALSNCLAERHIQFYADDSELQKVFERYDWAGGLADVDHDYILVVDSNVGYNKVSSSMDQTMAYSVDLATGIATLTISYRNTSEPTNGECDKYRQYSPSYEALTQGCYWGYVRVYVPAESELLAAEGAESGVTVLNEQGKTVLATDVLLPPGTEHRMQLRYRLPPAVWQGREYALLWQKQAGTAALRVTVDIDGAGAGAAPTLGGVAVERTPEGALTFRGALRRDVLVGVTRG